MRAILLAAVLLPACSTTPDATLQPRPGYFCGVDGVVCEAKVEGTMKPTGMCCAKHQTCGGSFPDVGCPAGQCCFVGPKLSTSAP